MTTTYERAKVAPWEALADGEWHTLREGPEGEAKAESERQYRRHYQSMRSWCALNRMQGQLSRTDHGRVLRVRLRPRVAEHYAHRLRGKSRVELGQALIAAMRLLEYALHLRQHGERAPGGNETWAEFDRDTEAFLRKLSGTDGPEDRR